MIDDCKVTSEDCAGKKIEVKMSMTANGCGMANVLKADPEQRLRRLPEVKEVCVHVLFEPPWHPGRMSETARLHLGLLHLEQPLGPFVHISRQLGAPVRTRPKTRLKYPSI